MSLRKAAFSAGRWTTASMMLRALLQITQTMILARLLLPEDFGLMATAGAIYAVVAIFTDMGMTNALIHFPKPSTRILSTLYWLNMGASLCLMLFFAGLAWPLAELYNRPMLIPVILTMSLALPLSAAGQQFRVMAEKDLRFTSLALIETTATLSGFGAALAIALAGGGVYSLVAALIAASTTGSLLAWLYLSKGLFPRFQYHASEAAPYVRFGAYRMGETLLNTLQTQADVLIGSMFAGTTAMGTYTVPRDLTLRVANTVVNPVITRVGLPVMAKVQNDAEALKSIYLQTIRMTSAVNFPIYAAMAVWAEQIVALLLGEQWHSAAFYIRIFAVWGMIRSVGNPIGSLLYATGQVKRALLWNLALLPITLICLLLGAKTGSNQGIAWTMLGIQIAIFLPLWRCLIYPICGATLREYLLQLLPAFASTIGAIAIGLVVSIFFQQHWIKFFASITTTMIAYPVLSWKLNRQCALTIFELIRPLWNRKAQVK
jgi:O-antigen/teichoic acid export membrane protein